MKVIFAQGNPGQQYTKTRHNVGFMALEAFSRDVGAQFTVKPKFKATIAEVVVNDEKVLLVKPDTFYNETGQSARIILDFYKLSAKDLLVVHDELMLPFGTVRTRLKGRDAGNNGIKSLNAHVGNDFARIRVGIGATTRAADTDFVLGMFTSDEQKELPAILKVVTDDMTAFINGTFAVTSRTATLTK